MNERDHCTAEMCPETSAKGQIVSIYVDYAHPLLAVQGRSAVGGPLRGDDPALAQGRKNTEGRPGLLWDVSLYGPLVVLMLVKRLNPREMEAYLAENVVARVFIDRQGDPHPQIRDHSNIARAYAALGKDGIEEINALVLHVAQRYGFVDIGILSSDTTAQELPMGYPNEPGILRGVAQRCGRALKKLKDRGGLGGRQPWSKSRRSSKRSKSTTCLPRASGQSIRC